MRILHPSPVSTQKSRLVKGGFCLFRTAQDHSVTVKLVVLVAVPVGVVIAIFPVFAPVGTVAVTFLSESTVNSVAATIVISVLESADAIPAAATPPVW
jgi:hypothetical protein